MAIPSTNPLKHLDLHEELRRLKLDHLASQALTSATTPTPAIPRITSVQGRAEMLQMRLRAHMGDLFQHYWTTLDGDTIYVLVVDKNYQPVMIHDSADLFPSDQLVTQLRMLAE
jgi:hypothetical protein